MCADFQLLKIFIFYLIDWTRSCGTENILIGHTNNTMLSGFVPRKVFFVKGAGRHKERLHSFEDALRNAGIEKFNLVRVSSILPPHCRIVQPKNGLKKLKPGQVVFCVMADNSTNEPNRIVSAAIGCAIPADRSTHGYISEHHSFGMVNKRVKDYAEDLAASMLASTLGVGFDADKNYDEKKEIFRMSGKIVKTLSIAQTAEGEKNGKWTTVVAAAVFCDY